jgi:sugar/nucleoside kinase (ribokinase family)
VTYELICLGNLTIDDVVLPDKTTRMGCFGGDAIYAALGASYWSKAVGFVAPVGTDFPKEHLAKLTEYGWDIRGLPARPIPSIRNWVFYEDHDQRTWELTSDPNDFFELSPTLEDIPADFREAKAFMILAMDLAAQETLAPALHKRGIVAVDPQEDYVKGNENRILAMLKNVDIFTPSQEEVFRLLGHRDDEKACREFSAYGAGVVIIKMGREGSLIFDSKNSKFFHIPIYSTKIVDTTGAGDAYCGGLMAMYVKTGDWLKAGMAGAVSASFAVEGFGLIQMFAVKQELAEARFRILETGLKEQGK